MKFESIRFFGEYSIFIILYYLIFNKIRWYHLFFKVYRNHIKEVEGGVLIRNQRRELLLYKEVYLPQY